MSMVSFGPYTFSKMKQMRTNFNNGIPISSSLPFAFGTWPETGQSSLPNERGMVEINFFLASENDPEGMDGLRDEGRAMKSLGMQKLVYQPTDPAEDTRYTWAVVNNIAMSQREDELPHFFQDVTIQFYCPYPFWMGGDYQGALAGDGTLIAATDLYFGEGALEIPCSGLSTSTTVTNNGNAPAVCIFTLGPQGMGETCQNPTIQRVANGVVVDEIIYNGIVPLGDSFEANGFGQVLNLNGASAYDDCEWMHPNLLRLMPGANTIRVKFTNAGDDASVFLYFADTWS